MSIIRELKRRNVIKVAIAYGVVAWLLIEVAATTFPMLRLPDWTATFVTVLLMLGYPVTLILAWAFEITPEGIKLEKDVDRRQSITHATGRNVDYIIIAALLLVLGFFTFDKFVLGPSRDATLVQSTTKTVTEQVEGSVTADAMDQSIAVLPFVNMSSDPEQEYFSDGISEELLNVLSKLPGLRVAARTSSFQFKGKNRDIVDIGKQLNTALVLEGSVRKADLQVRITAQLVDARSGFHLWSETYDRKLENIFAVQDEISSAIVAAVKEHLGIQVEVAPRATAVANAEALDAYLRGRYLVVQRTSATVAGAVREFENAITLAPDYALAHAELAIAVLLLYHGDYGELTSPEVIAGAAPHAARAMALEPTLAEAHAANGLLLWYQWWEGGMPTDLEEVLTHYGLAIRINPNYSIVYNWMGIVLASAGRYAESFIAHETALRLDPLSIPTMKNYVRRLIDRNRLADADRALEKLAFIDPSYYAYVRGIRESLHGKWANAIMGNLDAIRINSKASGAQFALTLELAILGLEEEAFAVSDNPAPHTLIVLGRPGDAVAAVGAQLTENPNDLEARRNLGIALAGAGNYERARPILEEMWQQNGDRVTCCGLFPPHAAAALIAIRRDAGEESGVGVLVAAIRDNVRRLHEAGITARVGTFWHVQYEDGLATYLSGEREDGLASIARAVEDGFFIWPNQAYLQTLYDDPGFAPILASQNAWQTDEREKVLAIVCADNPYAVVWQPAEESCERFAALDDSPAR